MAQPQSKSALHTAPAPSPAPAAAQSVPFQSAYPSLRIAYQGDYIAFADGQYVTGDADEIAFLDARDTCERA